MVEATTDTLFSLAGKRALVTGGTSGIGLMIAQGLVQRGVHTFIVGRNAATCEETAAALSASGRCEAIAADLSTLGGVATVTAALGARIDALDILVNNAGAMYEAPLDTFAVEGWDAIFDLNLRSVFFLTQQLLPWLRRAGQGETHASIINIGSIGGTRVGPKENYSYQAAKAGLHHLTRSLANRLGREEITVNAIAPGFFPSRLTQIPDEVLPEVLKQVPRRRMGRPDDMIGAVVFLASRAGSFITGDVLALDGGMAI